MQWHRELRPGDVQTAHRLLNQHQEYRGCCANALHIVAPPWPCYRAKWAYDVIAAEARGEVSEP